MDTSVKVSVVYHSVTGHVAEIARELATAAEKAGAEVRLRKVAEPVPADSAAGRRSAAARAPSRRFPDVPDATADDILWADAVIMGSPTRFGNISYQLKYFIDGLGDAWYQGQLADKVYSAFTSSGTIHGGNEATLLALLTSFHHFGGIVVAPGYTQPGKFRDGNPYGTSHCDGRGKSPVDETALQAARIQAQRVVRFAGAVTFTG
jgi:NAD(P)H dehydrogenase (quinone)